MEGYRRRLTSGEKSMVALNELRPPFVIQLTIEGSGDPAPEALYEALQQTTAVNPGSRLRLDEGESGDYWVLGPEPTFTVVDAPDFRASGAEDAPFLRWPLNASTGPTCELVHVRGQDRGYLIFRALHGVMDGQGTLLWAKDFMRCLRGEPALGHPSTIDVQTLCDDERDNKRPLPPYDALHPLGPAKEETEGRYAWRAVRVPGRLRSDASGRIAICLSEQAALHNELPGAIRIHLPTDLRAHCRSERSTGNLFGSLFLDVEADATPVAVGMKIVKMLVHRDGKKPAGLYAGNEAGTMAAHRVKAFIDLNHLHSSGRYAFSATLSHLGRLDSASLSGPGWQATSALFVPLVGDACVVSINGFDDHSVIAVGASDRHEPEKLDVLAAALRTALMA